MKSIARLLVVSSVLLASCSALLPQPTATPEPTSTPLPTATLTVQPTETATLPPPTVTPTPTFNPADLIPQGTPDQTWHGVRIMPGALSGHGDDKGYSFSIKADMADIETFYKQELESAGWTSFALGDGQSGNSLTIYMKDNKTFSVSIIAVDDLFVVLLVE